MIRLWLLFFARSVKFFRKLHCVSQRHRPKAYSDCKGIFFNSINQFINQILLEMEVFTGHLYTKMMTSKTKLKLIMRKLNLSFLSSRSCVGSSPFSAKSQSNFTDCSQFAAKICLSSANQVFAKLARVSCALTFSKNFCPKPPKSIYPKVTWHPLSTN